MNHYYLGEAFGLSMFPLIKSKDRLYVEKPKFNKIHIGDIIVYYNHRKLISHRVIWKNSQHYIVKGDNNYFIDPPVTHSQILGKLNYIENRQYHIRLNSYKASVIKYCFLLYSLIPYVSFKIIIKIFRGRKFIVKLISKQNYVQVK